MKAANPTGKRSLIRRLGRGAWVLGALLAIPAAVEWARAPEQFYRSYLVAFVFVLAPALGALAWMLLHRLTGGRWGDSLHEPLAAAAGTLPFVVVLVLPVLLGLSSVFPWAAADGGEGGAVTVHQHAFQQPPFFVARAVVYCLAWAGLAHLVAGQTRTGSDAGRPAALGAIGLIVYFLTVTLASVDWGMSLSPQWCSSIYGLLWILGQALAALSVAVLVRLLVAAASGKPVPAQTLQDMGSLLFAGVMTWAYVSFSQLLIIWSADLPAEVTWYARRLGPAWRGVALVLVAAHFLLPFCLLLMRKVKRRAAYLGAVCALVLAARLPDVLWMIVPSFRPDGIPIHWLDLVLPASLFALWCWLLLRRLERRLLERAPAAILEAT